MVTIEDVEFAFSEDNQSVKVFREKGVDHKVKAISLLRERIPYDVCPYILIGATHDMVYLCDIEKSLKYLSKEDLHILAECNVGIEDDNYIIFV